MAEIKRKTRMYEPWGYQDENNYESAEIIHDNDLASFFAETSYNKDDNKIYFENKDGEQVASLDVSEFVKSDSIVEEAKYEDGKIIIKFTNGDVITIDVEELIDENEFKDGLKVDEGVVTVLVDNSSDDYLSVSDNGVKVAGVKADIDAEQARAEGEETRIESKLDDEIARATSAETALDAKIDQEIADRTAAVNAEEARATSAETALQTALANEITRASAAEEALNRRNDALNDELDGEKTIREAADVALGRRIDSEIDDRIADVNEEEARATSAETDLQAAIEAEGQRAQDAETALDTKIDGVESALTEAINTEEARAMSAETDLQTAIDLKADKETTYTKEEVDALIKAKETEIYNLTKLVGEIGGNVVYDYPNDLGTSLTSLLNNSGTVKLGEDATISRFGPGITAKNKVKLNLNNHNITSTSAGGYGAIMSRGTQEITIYGKGTIDAGDGICIEANGKDSVINLTGSTTVYQTNRPGGELIYCYAGTINITNGTFKNNGSQYLLNCYDANYAAGTAKIIVTGGKFYDFNPADNSAEGEHTSFVPEGYHVETSIDGESTVYTVKKDA